MHFLIPVEAFLGNFPCLLMNRVSELTGDFGSPGVRAWLEEDLEMEPINWAPDQSSVIYDRNQLK